jgi:hypothetical protein
MKPLRLLFAALLMLLYVGGQAAQFKLTDGTTIQGDIISANETGVIVRGADGKLSPRVTWFKLSPESLAEAAKDPALQKYVADLVEPPPGETPTSLIKRLDLTEPPKMDRPTNVSLFSAALTPAGMAMGLVLFLANLFAAYEIAVFRNRQLPVLMIAAVVLPVLGPLLFLALPTRKVDIAMPGQAPAAPETPAPPALSPEEEAAEALRAAEQAMAAGGPPPLPVEEPPAATAIPVGIPDDEPAGPGLKIAKREAAPTHAPLDYLKSYKRGEQMMSRRFFESTLPGFFRITPSDFDKDLILVFRTVRGEYIGQRISRIANDDLHLQKRAGDVSSETPIAFNDIIEVIVRHKDAK